MVERKKYIRADRISCRLFCFRFRKNIDSVKLKMQLICFSGELRDGDMCYRALDGDRAGVAADSNLSQQYFFKKMSRTVA